MGDLAAYNNALAEIRDAETYLATFNFVENATTDDASLKETRRENTSRQATIEVRYQSTGSGQRRNKTLLEFPVVFRKEPHFTSGCATIKNPDAKHWHDPIGQVGVYAWKRDNRGYFTGAWLWTRVDVMPIDDDNTDLPPANVVTQHYLTFSAEAIKDVSSRYGKIKKAASLASSNRTVGL